MTTKSMGWAALTFALSMGLAGHAFAETVKIGIIESLSGPAAPSGISQRDTIKALVAEYNRTNAFNGHTIELVYADDQSTPTEAARSATRLIREDKVQAILGPTNGGSALALMPIAERGKVPVLAPVSTVNFAATSNSFFPWAFRVGEVATFDVDKLLEEEVYKPGKKKVAIFYQEDAYGKTQYDYAIKAIEKDKKAEVVAVVSSPPTAIDLTAAATKIRNADPEVVMMFSSAPAMGGAFVRASRQAGLDAQLVGVLGLAQKPFVEAAGGKAEGLRVVTFGTWSAPTDKQKQLGDLLVKAGVKPIGYAEIMAGTDAAILAEAIRRVQGGVTGQKIRDALETMCPWDGTYMNAPVCYKPDNHEGFGADVLMVVEVKDGEFVPVK